MNKTLTTHSMAFTVILLLMTVLIAIALDRIEKDLNNIDLIVNQNNAKTLLVNDMRTAARDRTVALMRMAIEKDPFSRDDDYMAFNKYGNKFLAARKKLMSMDLSVKELELLHLQGQLISKKMLPLQRKVTELAYLEKTSKAQELLLYSAIPKQNAVFELITDLQRIQEHAADKFVSEAKNGYKETRRNILLLALIIFISVIVLATLLIRRTINSEDNLNKEKNRAIVTLHSIGDGVITTNLHSQVESINSAAEILTGWTYNKAKNKNINDLCRFIHDSDYKEIENPVDKTLLQSIVIHSNSHDLFMRNDGNEFAVEYTASPIFDINKQVSGSVLVFRDVTEMRALSNRLSYQATHDSLTGLINRHEFEKRLEQTITDSYIENEHHILCYLDLDQFKVVNDTCGHVAGDELLKLIASTLREHVRESDLIARLGGDEFGILLKNCRFKKAKDIIKNTKKAINDLRFVWDDKSFNVGLSIGVVRINKHSGNISKILSAADTSCYIAKDEGRNRFHVYEDDDDTLIKRQGEMQWVHRINHALENDKFVLFFQTIEQLQNNTNSFHLEILVRLQNNDGKIVPPMAFLPAAERYDLMTAIDRWVISNTLKNFTVLGDEINGIIAINTSAQSLSDDKFLDFLTSEINKSSIDPSKLCFEITETSAITNLSLAMDFFASLKKIGCKFALDDFGSGLSSFAYLKNMPVDYLKIDGSFIRDIVDDPIDLAFVESINQIGRVMGIKTIAEYVENEQIYNLIKKIGIDYGQGYHLSHPEPLANFFKNR
ncbi:diguanylate cyclase/phosphodiesterase (GGDEF & EAL domains) with PAS/PAC sensor(s) [hydrothermal vent metagenome]|uniref:Diguanylate cyclase/phosphodiesterase (GGDEF & EAL domains) with PAS/PAC sensor(S) n=1 Tax=hydrothermal vent metagenome TaxID=652676 RepID=A0A3B0ZUY6_9ZZZZ